MMQFPVAGEPGHHLEVVTDVHGEYPREVFDDRGVLVFVKRGDAYYRVGV